MIKFYGIILLCLCGSIYGEGISSEVLATARKSTLDRHNCYRLNHNAANLTQDADLTAIAQSHAEFLASQTVKGLFRSNVPVDTGENSYLIYSTDPNDLLGDALIISTGVEATTMWYNEIKNYNFTNPEKNSKNEHFAQVVWRPTKKIGIGFAKGYQLCRVGSSTMCYTLYVVVNYSPSAYDTGRSTLKQWVREPRKSLTDLPY